MIDELRQKFEEFTEWATRSTKNLVISLVGLWGGALLLLFLAVWIPSVVTENALKEAQQIILTAQTQVENASTRYDSESKWPKPEYISGLAGNLSQAQQWLSNDEWTDAGKTMIGAQKALAKAKAGSWNPDDTLMWASRAKESADQAKRLGSIVITTLDTNAKLQSDARAQQVKTDGLFSGAQGNRTNTVTRFGQEKGDVLSKYTSQMETDLKAAQDAQTNGQRYIDAAKLMLPPANDTRNIGDPKQAMAEFDLAKIEIDKINTLAKQVTAGLDLQKEAKANSASRTKEAGNAVSNALVTIQNVVNTRGYTLDKALSQANAFYMQADTAQKLAARTLVSPIASEGSKLDYVLAYQSANEAISISGKVTTEVKFQTDTADTAQAKISQFPSVFAQVNTVVDQAARDLNTLLSYHAKSTWSDVSNAVNSARNLITEATSHFEKAKGLISLQVQQFVQGLSEINIGLDNLGSAQSQAQGLITKTASLEILRAQWPGAESSATNAINGASPTVDQYRGYSSRAVSELSSANGSLSSARSSALQLRWQDAINSANTAISQANNAKSWAKSDYDAEMARQRAAEEARQRAAEEAARAAAESSSPSNSWSGSSGGGGGSSNSWSESGGGDSNSW